jgi:ribosomal protein L34E
MSIFFRVKTPGGRLVYQYIHKRGSGVKCGDCGKKIHGVEFNSSFFFQNFQ